MKCFALIALAACQVQPPSKPAKALDPKDPKSVAEHAIYNTRSQSSYETRFKARVAPPKGSALEYTGQSVWVAPGVLYIHYTDSGGGFQNIVRVREKAWAYHLLGGWATAEELNLPSAGRGIQNPDEVLDVLSQHLAGAKLAAPNVVEFSFAGQDIEKIMREQAKKGAFDWKESQATVRLDVDGDTRIKKLSCEASLKSTDPAVAGKVAYAAQVDVTTFNGAKELAFQDDAKQPVELTQEMIQAIRSAKEKK